MEISYPDRLAEENVSMEDLQQLCVVLLEIRGWEKTWTSSA